MRTVWSWFVRFPAAAVAVLAYILVREDAVSPGPGYIACLFFAFVAFQAGRQASRIRKEQEVEKAVAPGSYWRRMQSKDVA